MFSVFLTLGSCLEGVKVLFIQPTMEAPLRETVNTILVLSQSREKSMNRQMHMLLPGSEDCGKHLGSRRAHHLVGEGR